MNSLSQIAPNRIVPVLVVEAMQYGEPLREALKTGGFYSAEVTLRSPLAIEVIKIMSEDSNFIVGAGTVTTPVQVEEVVEAGARFVVSPGLSTSVISRCRELSIPIFPGVCTPSDIMQALDLGLSELKFFPAELFGGTRTLRAYSGPFPSVRFMPTGGINHLNISEYLKEDTVSAVGTTWLSSTELMRDGNFQEITDRCIQVRSMGNLPQ
jgi:2-dehydro-3-deoxyphosphogluconate aldolase/(4S)-4-hydroxy-2-oxoglutarate aldolase